MLRPPELPNSKAPERDVLPSAVFLFGLSGAGKSYCGELLSRRLGFSCVELDQHLTAAMKLAIHEKRSFTDEMRDEYFSIIKGVVQSRIESGGRFIFVQGAYRERHRRFLKTEIPSLEFVCVSAPSGLIQQRLSARGDWVGPEYAAAIAKNFEHPAGTRELVNDGASDDELVERFVALFSHG